MIGENSRPSKLKSEAFMSGSQRLLDLVEDGDANALEAL